MPLESTEPAYKEWILKKRGLDPSQWSLDDNGNAARNIPQQPVLNESDAAPVIATKPQTSIGGTLLHQGAASIAPILGGLGGAGIAATLLAPETGGLSLLGLAAAGLAGAGAGYGVEKAQDAILPDAAKEQLALEQQEHPIASTVGGLIPSALLFNPVKGVMQLPSAIKAGGRAFAFGGKAITDAEQAAIRNIASNVGVNSGIDVASQLSSGQPFDWKRLGISAGTGAVFNEPSSLGNRILPYLGMPGNQPPIDVDSTVVPQPIQAQEPSATVSVKPLNTPSPITGEQSNPLAGYAQSVTTRPDIISGSLAGAPYRSDKMVKYKGGYDIPDEELSRAEGEGFGVTSQSRLQQQANEYAQKLEDFQKAKSEVLSEQIREAELQRQQLQEKNDTLEKSKQYEVTTKPGVANKLRITEGQLLQPSISAKPEIRPSITTEGTPINKAEVTPQESASDLEARRLEAQLGGDERPQYQDEEDSALLKNTSPSYQKALRELAIKRGITLKEAAGLINPETGKEVLGAYTTSKRTAEINPNKADVTTIPHEVGGHGFVNDLLQSQDPKDRALANRALEIFNGDKRGAEEGLAYRLGAKGAEDAARRLVGSKGEKFNNWFKDFVSRWKLNLGMGNDADVIRHLGQRIQTDAPYGSRQELIGKKGGIGKQFQDGDFLDKHREENEPNASKRSKEIGRIRTMLDAKGIRAGAGPGYMFYKGVRTSIKDLPSPHREMATRWEKLSDQFITEKAAQIPEGSLYNHPLDDETGPQYQEEPSTNNEEDKKTYDSLVEKMRDSNIKWNEKQNIWKQIEDLKNKQGGKKYQEESDLEPQNTNEFALTSSRLLRSEERLKLGSKSGEIDGGQLVNRLMNLVPPSEKEYLENAGIKEAFPAGQKTTRREVDNWIRDKQPRIETKVLRSGSNERTQMARRALTLQHELETRRLPIPEWDEPSWIISAERFQKGPVSPEDLEKVGYTEEEARLMRDYIAASDVTGRPTDGELDADVYRSIAPRDADQHVVMVRARIKSEAEQLAQYKKDLLEGKRGSFTDDEIKKRLAARSIQEVRNLGSDTLGYEGYLHIGNHFGKEDKNVLGWSRVQWTTAGELRKHNTDANVLKQLEGLKDGDKVAEVVETQSDWGQKMRDVRNDAKEQGLLHDEEHMKGYEVNDHPLLKHWEHLTLKATIDHAIKEGAKAIVHDDAETAMLTEGHDVAARPQSYAGFATENHAREFAREKGWKSSDYRIRYFGSEDGYEIMHNDKVITQEPGMRLHYDKTGPSIMEKLTGSKGEKVVTGEHQRAFKTEYTGQGRGNVDDSSAMRSPRDNLIFRNPDGTPKTTSTGRIYPLDKVKAVNEKTPNTLFGKDNVDTRFQENPQIHTPEFKKWFGDSKVVDKDGKPLVVYHGTSEIKPLDTLDRSKGKILDAGYFGQGTYLTENPSYAEQYTRRWDDKETTHGPVYPVYVKLENPATREILSKYSQEFSTYGKFNSMDESKRVTEALKKDGYDGIIIELPGKGEPFPFPYDPSKKEQNYSAMGYAKKREIVAFHPEQIKSAIGNKGTFDSKNPDIRFQDTSQDFGVKLGSIMKGKKGDKEIEQNVGWKTFKPTRTVHESILAKDGKDAEPVVEGFNKFYPERDRMYGKAMNPIMEAGRNLSNEQKNNVENALLAGRRDSKSYRDELRTPEEQSYWDTIRNTIDEKQREQINANQPVSEFDSKGRESKRLPKLDPNYYPNQIDPNVINELQHNPKGEKAKQLKKAFEDYYEKEGYTKENASETLNGILSAYDKGATDLSHFRGVSIEKGAGLPDEWMRPGIERNLQRYFRRVSNARAFHDTIQSQPEVAQKLGFNKDPWGKEWSGDKVEPLQSREAYDVLKHIKGEDFDQEESKVKSFNRLATSLFLGPLTNIHIAASSLANAASYFRPTELPGALKHIVENLGSSYSRALENGYATKNPKIFRDLLDAHSTALEKVNSLADGISRISGRGATNFITKGILQSAGEYLTKVNIPLAQKGDMRAISLMKHIDPEWKMSKQYTPEEVNKLASNFGNILHGAHDSRTLPAWMLKETAIQPFFSLASWSVSQTNNFMRHVWTPATQGNYTPLIMSTLGAGLGGYAIKELREKLANKESPIPTLEEIARADTSTNKKIPLVAYNLMAMSSFAGYAGILSTLAKTGFDIAYKNAPQGAAFPLDEAATNTVGTMAHALSAIVNADGLDEYARIGSKALADLLKENVQLARVGISWGDSTGLLGEERQQLKKKQSYENDLRKYKMIEGMPYNDQAGGGDDNPYYYMARKGFQRDQNLGSAMQKLPSLISDAIESSNGNIEVLRGKLRALKQSSYPTMPSPDTMPATFIKYVQYLKDTKGDDAATERMVDYIKHNAITKMKNEMVPSF